jgi:hypothetical protein
LELVDFSLQPGVEEHYKWALKAFQLQSCNPGSRGEFQLNRAVQDVKG